MHSDNKTKFLLKAFNSMAHNKAMMYSIMITVQWSN